MSSAVEEFRASGGNVDSPFAGSRMVLLTTVSGGDGARRTTAVPYLPDMDRFVVIAADGDVSRTPEWYRDIVAHPRVTVETGKLTFQADAEVIEGEERGRLFARAVAAERAWAAVGPAAMVPVVALHPVNEGPPNLPLGEFLVAVHDTFRRELTVIREEISGSSATLGAQLRVNCLTFCHLLHGHHTGESERMFPLLAQRHPDLAAVLGRLEREHGTINRLLDEMQVLLKGAAEAGDLLAEFDRLAADLESHLAYEEDQLVSALNNLSGSPS